MELRSADRDLLIAVHRAGLWEGQASVLAQQHGNTARVCEVGAEIVRDYDRLDPVTRSLAGRLGVALPDTATREQQAWTDEIRSSEPGQPFDRVYVNRLRAAHGTLFELASQVRAATLDDAVRAFAQTVVETMLRQLNLLESTGVAEPGSLVLTAARGGNTLGGADFVLAAVMVVIAGAATFRLIRLLGSPSGK
ncbi:DUF4142 domain-containing protein [Amycolatopsis sp. NPDC059657]|uniref:DUF4142 domain-containing protein n=1 Tax=Amycolatopsis sp. NPDC059657 TaxID=3346899 RepID=UPI00366E07E8